MKRGQINSRDTPLAGKLGLELAAALAKGEAPA